MIHQTPAIGNPLAQNRAEGNDLPQVNLIIPFFSLILLLGAPLVSAQDEKTLLPEPQEPAPAEEGATDVTATDAVEGNEPAPDSRTEDVSETPPSGDAEGFSVSEQMGLFKGHVGSWKGMTKSAVTEKGTKTVTTSRGEWTGGFLLGGHVFEIRGFSYGELGRTQYRWQYTYDALKERYMSSYYDSHGRTHFAEGKVNQEQTKIIWRLLAPPGDMAWHAETDLQPENGIDINGRVTSEDFDYDMVYTSVFKKS